MVRAAAKNHPSVAIVTSPDSTPTCSAQLPRGASRSPSAGALAAAAFVHTATYDVHVASWIGNVLTDTSDGSGFPAWVGATWDRGVGAALRREPPPARRALHQRLPAGARPGPGPAAARQGDVLQQLRRRRRGMAGRLRPRRPADGGDHQARQPVRHRGRARTSPRRTARRTPATRCRRTAASSPPTGRSRVELAEQVTDIFTEVIVAPAFEEDARRGAGREEEPAADGGRPGAAAGGVETRPISGGC